ncbi:hypothetical protein OG418_49840 [Streptomyces phaeochromogenes]|uniref:hypothetical protein n=2 Tax=Streptomyces phaeochromogenes TaxID=1923 RepID=UPI002DD86B89|nr:hypothetical protein [Streptomyces phaeochromogenes]WRZ26337.1 hypothetical protein OG931_00525 [Streptomyces phaeochromogenes]
MAEATVPSGEREPGAKMTIRVYAMSRAGQITEDRGTLSVMPGQEPLPTMGIFPPCDCPRHRGQRLAL